MHDVIVAGGGPAGLAVALGAAQAGLDVVICEKRAGVVDKACGEGLMPGALQALQALGVDPPGRDIRGISYRQGSSVAEARFRGPCGRGVRRTALHEALQTAVSAYGVPILPRSVKNIVQSDDHVEAAGMTARYLVAADGLHSGIRKTLGLQVESSPTPRWGQRQHYALAPWTDLVEVTWARRSEAYITPIGPDTVGVAVLSGERGSFAQQLREFPELVARLDGAHVTSTVRGAGPLRQGTSRRRHGRVLFVGDAAGYIDALTGEGLALSLAGAAELVRCLTHDRVQNYDRAWSRVSRRSRWITTGLLWARYQPALKTRIVPLAARTPRLFGVIVNQLASS